jgi:rhodanese-related sulfurtransferase
MAPFVPDIISDQLNLVVALLLGIAFGAVLEQAGFSSSRRLAGVFYGYDFTVLRVFFTAAVTAMCGVLILGHFGMLDTDAIYVNPTWLVPAIVGGAIMGVGFILGGYCPGTSVCAAAIGKVDAMFFVGGGILGVFGFGELYSLYHGFYDSTALGPVKVFNSLGLSQGLFAFGLIVVAVGAFAATTLIEKRVNRSDAPSLAFRSRSHFAAGTGAILLGIVFIVMPDRKAHLLSVVNDPAYIVAHEIPVVTVDELAFRIVDKEPNIRIIDVRTADEYTRLALPGSTNIPAKDLFGREWIPVLSQRHVKKVVVAQTEQEEQSAALLLGRLGYENVALLQGGMDSFRSTILEGPALASTGTRWDADVNEFRRHAHAEIAKMIEANKKSGARVVKTEKKIQGGC